jgi:mannan endo-1,4-beta-mannosidase
MPSGIVFRFWAFQNFFVSNGQFDWTNLDRVLAIAAAHGDRVIPVLANQYDYCDGAAKDLAWYQSGYESRIEAGEIVPYEQYVSAIVTRYADSPTIAMWQLVNEAQATNADGSCDESTALSALTGFSDAVGGLVHRLDPNHLVSLGAIAGYSGSGSQWCGAANSDYQVLMSSAGTDVCDFHDYGYPTDPMSSAPAPNLASAIQMCHEDGKPLMVGETGIYASSDGALPQRAAEFSAKFVAQFQAGVVGELMWAWAVKPQYRPTVSDSNYAIFPGDPSLGVLSRFINSA